MHVRRFCSRCPAAQSLSATIFLLASISMAGPRDAGVRIQDGGVPRDFDIARDEVRVARPGTLRIESLAPAVDFRELRRTAARQRRAAGEEVELVLYEKNRPHTESSRRYLTRRVLAVVTDPATPANLAARCGATDVKPAPLLKDGWFFTAIDSASALDLADGLRAAPGVTYAEAQLARQRERRAPNDTLFTNQWHLRNTGQNGATAGIDVNVSNVWVTRRGEGITIGIIDDGVQYTHPDLSNNYNKVIDYDFNEDDADPVGSVTNEDFHGTECAGVAAAYGSNGLGVAGAAYRANLVGLRLIAYPNTDEQEAAAISHSNDLIQIKSSSWGPTDDGITLEGPDPLTRAAMEDAAVNGRQGRGTILVWAGGNGGDTNVLDNANKDGYANSIYSIAVGAVNDLGLRASYSETGACLVVCAPSDDWPARQGITTTDHTGDDGYNYAGLGTNDLSDRNYTKLFGGTSAAAPLLSGIMALMLQANTNLGWRDAQEILMLTATKHHTGSVDWVTNAAGIHFNHAYGAGLVNARLAVNLASIWSNLGTHTWYTVPQTNLSVAIPDNNTNGIVRTFNLSGVDLRAEHVTVELDIEHQFRGDVDLLLTSPSGTRSSLVGPSLDFLPDYRRWPFMTVRNWGESANGTWTLRVADRGNQDTGTLRRAVLTVYGSATNGAAPIPEVEDRLIDDSPGNGNGAIDPGEPIEERIVVINRGGTTTNMAAILSTTTPGVTMLVATSGYPNAATQQRVTNDTPFAYRLAKSVGCGAAIDFSLRLFYHGTVRTTDFSHVVGTAVINSAVTNSFDAGGLPLGIQDGMAVIATNTISVAGSPTLDDVNVSLRINHTAAGDLGITVTHPDGTEVALSSYNGGLSNNFGTGASCASAVRTVFDDEAASNLFDALPPYAGSFRPDGNLGSLDGKPMNGDWRVRLIDIFGGDTGTLLCATIQAVYHTQTQTCQAFNTAPVASNQAATAAQDASTNLVLAGSDADGDPFFFIIVGEPSHGAATGLVAGTGALTYVPTNGYCGTDTFTFVTWDTYTNSDVATVTVAVACSDPDTDDDGLPDAWENEHFGDLVTAGTNTDSDVDGFIDLHEFLAGTQPTNPASLLVATMLTSGAADTVIVQWQSASDRFYSVDGLLELITDNWSQVTSGLSATPPLNVFTAAAASNAVQLFRIELEAP